MTGRWRAARRLIISKPAADCRSALLRRSQPAEYTFDPANPCPTLGGNNLTIARGPRNQNPIESRPDVVLFTTEPLAEPLEVTGRVTAKVFVASSAVDSDLSIRLCDVYPGRQELQHCRRDVAAAFSQFVRKARAAGAWRDYRSRSRLLVDEHRLQSRASSAGDRHVEQFSAVRHEPRHRQALGRRRAECEADEPHFLRCRTCVAHRAAGGRVQFRIKMTRIGQMRPASVFRVGSHKPDARARVSLIRHPRSRVGLVFAEPLGSHDIVCSRPVAQTAGLAPADSSRRRWPATFSPVPRPYRQPRAANLTRPATGRSRPVRPAQDCAKRFDVRQLLFEWSIVGCGAGAANAATGGSDRCETKAADTSNAGGWATGGRETGGGAVRAIANGSVGTG